MLHEHQTAFSRCYLDTSANCVGKTYVGVLVTLELGGKYKILYNLSQFINKLVKIF